MAEYFDTAAELGSEEEDEDFDGENGETRRPANGANGMDDSSEEEDDDDEDRLREEGAGFIADEDEEEEELSRKEKRRRKKRKNREEDEALDEDDLALIGVDVEPREASQSKYKRLKRGHKERPSRSRGIDEIFSDEDEAEDVDDRRRTDVNEFADFIEEDQFEDEIEDDREVEQPGVGYISKTLQFTNLDEGAEEDYRAAFGDGTDYDWAIDLQEQADAEEEGGGRELQLKDVFEPSQLKERMLTDEDNAIREKDIPERLQLARKPFPDEEISEQAQTARLDEESIWITQLLWPKKDLDSYFQNPFRKAVRKVLEFLNVDNYEVPFIFNHRKDYLIHAPSDAEDDADEPAPRDVRPERLLNQSELWEIFDLDLKFRAFVEKRDALQRHYDNLKSVYPDIQDAVIEDLVDKAVTIEEIQELQDYLHFRYAGEMNEVRQETTNGAQKRANNSRNFYDKLRGGKTASFVHAIGISPDDFAKKAEGSMPGGHFIEDQQVKPEELADQLAEPPEIGVTLLRSAKLLYTQELQTNPRLRRYVRGNFYQDALIDCVRTEKGMRKITEDHPYYEFKYLRKQTFMDLNGRPDLFLKMLKAEEEGLIGVKIRMGSWENLKRKLHNHIVSDNVSEVSELWNAMRKEMLDTALDKLHTIIANGVKETLRARCEDELASRARESYYNKLDQAPFKPRGADLGAVPNVLCLSNGKGQRGDAIMWAYVESDGRVLENGKLIEFRLGNRERGIPDGKDIEVFVEICNRRKPDVIGISGFSVETRRLKADLEEIINQYDLKGPQYEETEDNVERSDPLEVIYVNDEVARLYYNSARASTEFPKYPPLTRYCVALGRYLQNPLAEYASLGRDIVSLPFVQNQTLISQEKLFDRLENAMVDMVNLVGFNLPDGYDDPYMSKLLPYICGLGPRKADRLVKAIQANGDEILSRFDLIGLSEQDNRDLKQAMGPKVFANCASFLWLNYDSSEEASDYLDNTRVHPEDYDLARKMVADSMNLDEEDIKAEIDEAGPSAVIRRMVREDQTDLIHDLDLEGYARDIQKNLGIRKRATLETIRAELSDPYEEIRQTFALMSSDEIFTMLTGETKESLHEGMVVPVQIKRTFQDHIEVRLECGVEGGVTEVEFPEGVGSGRQAPRDVFQSHQTVRAKIVFLNRKALTAQLSLREDLIRQPMRLADRIPGDWDEQQETEDKKAAEREKEVASGRPNRVVNHPLFFSFSARQAEEYLGSKEPGEAVIRPSSKGFDHLAVTWKVSDNSFQHIDVLEMNKASEYSVGKQLRVGKSIYSDLDELIVNHVEAMARKVAEIMKDDRFQKGTKEETEAWLENYCSANPQRSIYAFCSIPKHPGYFWLCYLAGKDGKKGEWPVKVIPNAFEMQKNVYPDMVALKNGFKMLFRAKAAMPGPGPGPRPPTVMARR